MFCTTPKNYFVLLDVSIIKENNSYNYHIIHELTLAQNCYRKLKLLITSMQFVNEFMNSTSAHEVCSCDFYDLLVLPLMEIKIQFIMYEVKHSVVNYNNRLFDVNNEKYFLFIYGIFY